MDTANFLFPRELEVNSTGIKKILIIGSCLSRTFTLNFRENYPEINFDHILFNNASDLPKKNSEEISDIDLQYIQIPLRSVLTDASVRIADNEKLESPLDWIEIGKQNIDSILSKAMSYNLSFGIFTLVSNFIVPQGRIAPSVWDSDSELDLINVVRELNTYLASEVRHYKNAFIADIDIIANSLGKMNFLDDAIGFYSHGSVFYTDWSGHERFPHWTAPSPGRLETVPNLAETYPNKNEEFFSAVFRQIESIYRTVMQMDQVKIVIFDLDNTLWRGQLIEHYQPGMKWPYSDGWPLGLWEAIHHLRRRGIVVSLASKNDEELVRKKWSDAVQPPFIDFDHFISPQISWAPKAEKIQLLLDQLSLTPKSALFIDDNPVEREAVQSAFPSIRVLGNDPFIIRRILLWAPETQVPKRSTESLNREKLLSVHINRENERKKLSRHEFLHSLKSEINFWKLNDLEHPSYSRVSELVNKTNQFNTNGQRWSHEDYIAHFTAGGKIFAFSVQDRFTEYGIVGVIFTMQNHITQYIMSCRVLGMEIESAVISKIVDELRKNPDSMEVTANIVETESNTPCRMVYINAGFQQEGDAQGYTRFILPQHETPKIVEHIRFNVG